MHPHPYLEGGKQRPRRAADAARRPVSPVLPPTEGQTELPSNTKGEGWPRQQEAFSTRRVSFSSWTRDRDLDNQGRVLGVLRMICCEVIMCWNNFTIA